MAVQIEITPNKRNVSIYLRPLDEAKKIHPGVSTLPKIKFPDISAVKVAQQKGESPFILFVPLNVKRMGGLGIQRTDSIASAESPSILERFSGMTIKPDELQRDCEIIMLWDLEWACENGEMLYLALGRLRKLLDKLKKGTQRDRVKAAVEHLDGLSRIATTKVSPRGSRSPS